MIFSLRDGWLWRISVARLHFESARKRHCQGVQQTNLVILVYIYIIPSCEETRLSSSPIV